MKVKELKEILLNCLDDDDVNVYCDQYLDGFYHWVEIQKAYRDTITEQLIIECKN